MGSLRSNPSRGSLAREVGSDIDIYMQENQLGGWPCEVVSTSSFMVKNSLIVPGMS